MPAPVVIANPTARGADDGIRAIVQACADARLEHPRIVVTSAREHGGPQAQAALRSGASSVVAIGGDGTVREVASVLAHSSVPLGIVPAGTANLFARNLRIPHRDHRAAARAAITGHRKRVDLGRAAIVREGDRSWHPFLVVAGVGHDAEAVRAASLQRKRRLGWLAYVDQGVRRWSAPLIAMRATFDDGPTERTDAWTVLVHNTARIPGGFSVVPNTRPDDGVLHVAVVSPRRLLHWGRIAASGMGIARAAGIMSHRAAHRVAIEPARPVHVQIDGDALGLVSRLEARIDPGALVVRSPEVR